MKQIIIIWGLFLCSILSISAQPKVIGHRGCRFNTKENPVTPNYENTLEALKFAQSLGIYAAEFDINLTSDGKLVVYHGPAIPGNDKKIQEMTYKETRKVILPGGHKIPSLKEWFKQAKKHPETKIIMEIKKHPTKELETEAVEKSMKLVKKMKMQDQVEYTTFSEWICQEIHRVDPNVKVIYISSSKVPHPAQYLKDHNYNGMSYENKLFMNNPQLVKDCKKLGIETTMWIVNNKEQWDWAVKHGVDFVSSDHPELIKTYRDELLKK